MTSQGNDIELDDLQSKAVTAHLGPVAVEGAPGSGKTTALITRALVLMKDGVPPESLFFLTPGDGRQALAVKTAISNDVPRLTDTIPHERISRLKISSYRGLAISWLRRFGPEVLGIPKDFGVWSRRRASLAAYGMILENGSDWPISASEVPDVMRWHRFRRSSLPEIAVAGAPSHWHEFLQMYEEEKRRRGVLDQDDVIAKAIEVMEKGPGLIDSWRDSMKPHFLADNFHNMTPVEYRFLQTITGRNASVMVAGDRNQSVGSWWGADPGLIDQFKRDNSRVQCFTLYLNHRFSEALFEIVFRLARREPLRPLPEQSAWIEGRTMIKRARLLEMEGEPEAMDGILSRMLREIRENGFRYSEMAILCRRHSSIDRVQHSLATYGIPYTVSGDTREQGSMESTDSLSLTTIHGAQGSQWPYVLILDASDDILPGPLAASNLQSLAEEQRLFYVAATRASEYLDISFNTQNGRARATRFTQPIRGLLKVQPLEV